MHDSPCRHPRRDAVRLLGLAALTLPAALRPSAAYALRGWCRLDPIVMIDGQLASIFVASYLEMQLLATGKTQVIVTVPPGVRSQLVATDVGFGLHGYDVRFAESGELTATHDGLDIQIEVVVPARDAREGPLPVTVDFIPIGFGRLTPGSAEGLANTWVILRAPEPTPPPGTLPPGTVDTTPPTSEDQNDKKKSRRRRGKKKRG
ncbi:MAG TPA: hypothetical protein VER55_09230 [Ardenticatenaceae bacterium]|nr:hypothetical protein [Ardenticatenaceae bacterium]